MVGKKYIESMLYEGGFGAATEMGEFTLEKVTEVSLVPEPFWTSIFTSLELFGSDAKRSVSTTFFPYGSLNTKPLTLLILPLQYIQIQSSAF